MLEVKKETKRIQRMESCRCGDVQCSGEGLLTAILTGS